MPRRTSTLLRFVPAAVVATLLPPAAAQAVASLSPDRVTFYTDPNFKGEALVVEAGASIENLDRITRTLTPKPWTFAISSVKVEGAAKAVVYTGPNFSGERLEISGSIPDLYAVRRTLEPGTWDRAIASLSVTGPRRAPATTALPPVRYEQPASTVHVVPTPTRPAPPVTVHEIRPRMDRRTAELIVQRAYREVLNRPADPEGLRRYRDRLIHDGWSERQLIEHLQRSAEARSINADEAIRQAYRDVLGRDPDPGGLAHYRSKWRDGWTQGQIRGDLRRSREGRDLQIRNAITRAYRDLLGREPDPGGLANYERLMRERGYTERDVRNAIMAGEEYRERRAKQ